MDAHLVSPRNPARKIHGLYIAQNQHRGLKDDAYHARYVNLQQTVAEIGKRANLGIDIVGDEYRGAFYFDVVSRRDRTVGQSDNKPLVLEMSRYNVDSSVYQEDHSQERNVFYCSRAGDEYEWETLTQTYYSQGTEPTGYARREKSLSISVYEDGDQYEQLETNARKEMENYKAAETVKCVMSRRMVYGTDYLIGDYVTVRDRAAGVESDMEIVSVDTVLTDTTINYVAEFGEPRLTRFDTLKRETRRKK